MHICCLIKYVFIVLHVELAQSLFQQISDYDDDKLKTIQIRDLCTGNDASSYECICFAIKDLSDEMIQNLCHIGIRNNIHNILFEGYWKQNASALTNAQNICFTDVYNLVFQPTIKQCGLLICNLFDKSVKLSQIEWLSNVEHFSDHLSALSDAMVCCYPAVIKGVPPANQWVLELIEHITLYQEIGNSSKCVDAANVLLNLQKSLCLTGDFKYVENLVNHVSYLVM